MIACKYCNSSCIKYGRQKNNRQRYKCSQCGKTQQDAYTKRAYGDKGMNSWIAELVKEGCGIRSMARLLRVAVNTIMKRIKSIAAGVRKPPIVLHQEAIEVDELRTYIGSKKNDCWIAYALSRRTVMYQSSW